MLVSSCMRAGMTKSTIKYSTFFTLGQYLNQDTRSLQGRSSPSLSMRLILASSPLQPSEALLVTPPLEHAQLAADTRAADELRRANCKVRIPRAAAAAPAHHVATVRCFGVHRNLRGTDLMHARPRREALLLKRRRVEAS